VTEEQERFVLGTLVLEIIQSLVGDDVGRMSFEYGSLAVAYSSTGMLVAFADETWIVIGALTWQYGIVIESHRIRMEMVLTD
jgi:hypothetical protein